jgi:sarcosine dehydrogenase
MNVFPTQARAVIVGGGIIGLSTAYHLAREGWKDVVVLERAKLTSGSTWHAAGLVGQLRSSANVTRLLGHSVDLYKRLEAETGQATGWRQTGGLRLACNRDRLTELERQATVAHSFGLEMHMLTPAEALELWPAMRIDDLVGASFLPSDGQTNPSDTAMALAAGARKGGVTIIEDCAVTGVTVEKGRVSAVTTERGTIACEVVVNCAGQWAREFGRLAGVNVPLASMEHQYLITEAIPGLPKDLPTMRDPDRRTYYKEEVGGLVMGGYEPDPEPWARGGIPHGLGPVRPAHGKRRRPCAGAGDRGRQAAAQRARKLHARRLVHPGRGAGGGELLCRCRLQRLRHRQRGWCGQGARRMGRGRRATHGPLGRRYPPLRPAPRRCRLCAQADRGGLRPPL